MTLDKTWYLTCDSPAYSTAGLRCEAHSPQTVDGGPVARQLAQAAGWSRVPNPGWQIRPYRGGVVAVFVDVCPPCAVHYADVLAAAAEVAR